MNLNKVQILKRIINDYWKVKMFPNLANDEENNDSNCLIVILNTFIWIIH